ncbi:hypothetical protein, partial [Tessaracoccus sp. ZS01]|uniref:hypothetical protein n=1 Tax=Tessaracoccus sp. ZS01 TaxID=1906324 RepID=UPI001E357CFE
ALPVHVFGIDLKHTVEFSSFGCDPRFNHTIFRAIPAWGNSINLTRLLPAGQIRAVFSLFG